MADLTAAREALVDLEMRIARQWQVAAYRAGGIGQDVTNFLTEEEARAKAAHLHMVGWTVFQLRDLPDPELNAHRDHLRAALAEVDRLTAELAEARAELANEHGKGDGPSFGWACRGGEWEKTEDDYLSVRRLDTYSVRWEVWRLDECIAAGSAETFRAGMRAADRAVQPKESP